MFTGIIEGFGTFRAIRPAGHGTRFAIESDFDLDATKIGDSIAVNGACLTAVTLNGRRFEVDVAPETLSKTTFGAARVGERINLERALKLSDRIDGHLVSGHVDGVGVIQAKQVSSNAVIVTVGLSMELHRYMIVKGSVAIDGISLTINKLNAESIELSIIPHTAAITSIGFKKPGDRVNIETDLIGKYVEKFVTGRPSGSATPSGKASGLDKAFLLKAGFL